ncbi:MAG TPA: ferritin-like domain-containing protein [Trebonia sp.]
MATTQDKAADTAALQAALAAEHAAVYGYGVVGALMQGNDQHIAMSYWTLHQVARDTLTQMIVKFGGTPVAASAAYDVPFTVDDAASARRLAVYIEDGVTRAYFAIVAVSDAGLRTFGALAMQEPANRATAWSGQTTEFPGMSSATPTSGLSGTALR